MGEDKRARTPARGARKLLVAAVGVATVNYATMTGCGSSNTTSGNLPAPPPSDATTDTYVPPTSGNLPAPPPPVDSGADAADADAADAADADAADDGG